MNEQLQAIIDGLYDALPSTISSIADLLDGDPQVVQLRQAGKTERARIRADEDIQRAKIKRNYETALEYVDNCIDFYDDGDPSLSYDSSDIVRELKQLRAILD